MGACLARCSGRRCTGGDLKGIKTPVSRLVFGVDNQRTYPHGAVMFDDFVEQGGTCFDTAWLYWRGRCEQIFGDWMRNRGVRDELVVIGKGCHTPLNSPEHLGWQLIGHDQNKIAMKKRL